MNYLSACLIIKNEEKYLREWIDYHIKAGVEKFFIYENESDNQEETRKIINEYGDLIIYHEIKGAGIQNSVYNHCIENYKNDSRWIAMIDTDEFIVPKKIGLKDAISRYEEFPAIGINWLMFGSNGHEKVYDENYSVLKRFTKCCKINKETDYSIETKDFNNSVHIKSIVDPKKVLYFPNPHFAIYADNKLACDENYNLIDGKNYKINFAGTRHVSHDIFQINHYNLKSWEEFKLRKAYKTPDRLTFHEQYLPENLRNTFDRENKYCNEIENLDIFKILGE